MIFLFEFYRYVVLLYVYFVKIYMCKCGWICDCLGFLGKVDCEIDINCQICYLYFDWNEVVGFFICFFLSQFGYLLIVVYMGVGVCEVKVFKF